MYQEHDPDYNSPKKGQVGEKQNNRFIYYVRENFFEK